MSTSDTPRTDAEAMNKHVIRYNKAPECAAYVSVHLSRTLERELNAALARVRDLEREKGELTDALRTQNARVAELEGELAKLNDPVAVHINMLRGTIATPSRELMEHVWHGDPPSPHYLERPDKPGWWWAWEEDDNEWGCLYFSNPSAHAWKGIWLPATPPPPPSKEDVG